MLTVSFFSSSLFFLFSFFSFWFFFFLYLPYFCVVGEGRCTLQTIVFFRRKTCFVRTYVRMEDTSFFEEQTERLHVFRIEFGALASRSTSRRTIQAVEAEVVGVALRCVASSAGETWNVCQDCGGSKRKHVGRELSKQVQNMPETPKVSSRAIYIKRERRRRREVLGLVPILSEHSCGMSVTCAVLAWPMS